MELACLVANVKYLVAYINIPNHCLTSNQIPWALRAGITPLDHSHKACSGTSSSSVLPECLKEDQVFSCTLTNFWPPAEAVQLTGKVEGVGRAGKGGEGEERGG